MSLNMQFDRFAAVRLAETPWIPSPNGEVERKQLERAGGESGWATSVVRYAPGARFPTHAHPDGEEFLVLDGVFSDEFGDYPVHTYVRNPPDSRHAPFSRQGCLLFVKLCQMRPDHEHRLVVPGGAAQGLFEDAHGERVALRNLEAGAGMESAGMEILVLDGTIRHRGHAYEALSWLRFPNQPGALIEAATDALLWTKRRPDLTPGE